MRTARNPYVELLRIVSMSLVVACHAAIHLDWGLMSTSGWRLAIANVIVQGGQLGVAIFFIITGYFMADKEFRLSRLIEVWLRVFIYSVVCLGISWCVYKTNHMDFLTPLFESWGLATTLKTELLPISSVGYWFMTTYVFVLLLSPYLNAAFKQVGQHTMLMLAVGLLAASSMSIVGLQALQLTRLTKGITCYVLGGYIRFWGEHSIPQVSFRTAVLSTFACAGALLLFNRAAKSSSSIVAWLGWEAYYHDGPQVFWMLPAIIWVRFATQEGAHPASPLLSHFTWLGSHTLGVYLIHENYLGHRILWALIGGVVSRPYGVLHVLLGFVLVVLVLYFCLLLAAVVLDSLLVNPICKLAHSLFWSEG